MGDGVLVVVNKDWFEKLPADFKADLLDVAAQSTDVVLKATIEREVIAREAMAKAGIQFTDFTAEMKEPWRALMGPAYDAIKKNYWRSSLNELIAVA